MMRVPEVSSYPQQSSTKLQKVSMQNSLQLAVGTRQNFQLSTLQSYIVTSPAPAFKEELQTDRQWLLKADCIRQYFPLLMNLHCYLPSLFSYSRITTPLVSLSQEKEITFLDFLDTIRKTPSLNQLCFTPIIKIQPSLQWQRQTCRLASTNNDCQFLPMCRYEQSIKQIIISFLFYRLLMGKQFRDRALKAQSKTAKIQAVKEQVKETKLKEEKEVLDESKDESKVAAPKDGKAEKSKGKRNRLIIRNLVFDVTEKHLRKLLQPYGQIFDLEVPLNPNNNKCNRGFAFVQYQNFRSCEKAIKELNQSTYKGRTIVLDFSINKQRFMTAQLETNGPKDSQEIEEEKIEIKQEKNEQPQEPQEQGEENREEQIRKQRDMEDLSTTIFIRNLPISVDQDQLRDFFAKYGKIRWARVVIDKETKTPKGTAFVKFVDAAVAQQLIEYSRSYEMFLLNKNPRFKSDPKFSLEIEGTILKIFPGEKREAIADKMKDREQKDALKEVKVKPLKKIRRLKDLITFDKDGKRNIVLAELGLWQANDDMDEEDRAKFTNHYKEKIEKLKNPNNSVSTTRIILKFLDKNITEEQIKDLAHEFLNAHSLKSKELTFCKLMLDKERQKSAGFAFIEFAHHENSRKFIEELSEGYTYLMPRPYVIEFAIQDSRKMQKIQSRK